MNRYQDRTWSTLNSIKTLFGCRNINYQLVSQSDIEESKYSIDENTSCLVDEKSIQTSKSSLTDCIDSVNIKQIDEILPLMTEKSFNLQTIVPPVSTYTNDTRPDVDLLEG